MHRAFQKAGEKTSREDSYLLDIVLRDVTMSGVIALSRRTDSLSFVN